MQRPKSNLSSQHQFMVYSLTEPTAHAVGYFNGFMIHSHSSSDLNYVLWFDNLVINLMIFNDFFGLFMTHQHLFFMLNIFFNQIAFMLITLIKNELTVTIGSSLL